MPKVKLTIIKDNSVATIHPSTEIVQEISEDANECSYRLNEAPDADMFMFGKAVIYIHGVQAFIFEDIEE